MTRRLPCTYVKNFSKKRRVFPSISTGWAGFWWLWQKGLRIITNQECDYISLFIHIENVINEEM